SRAGCARSACRPRRPGSAASRPSLSRGRGGGNLRLPPPRGQPLRARRRRPRRRRRRLPVLLGVPLLRALLEVLPALGVPGPGPVVMTAPSPRSSEDPPDHEEGEQEEQDREQEEPWEEERSVLPHDMDDLDLLAVLLRGLDLFQGLGLPGVLARVV